MKPLQVTIIAQNGIVFSGKCTSLTFPGADGRYGIQPGFENSFFKLEAGTVTVTYEDKKQEFKTLPGTLLCENGDVTVLTEIETE